MPKTTINKKVFQIPKTILLSGKVLQFVSPYLAMRFAFKLFMTPYKFKRPRREQNMYKSANKEMILVSDLNKKIQTYKLGSTDRRVLLIHGWAGRGTQLFKIAEVLQEQGYSVISFDATAHGDSEGKTSAMTEFIPSILAIESHFGQFEYAIGHSLGAMALLNAVKQGFKARKIVLIGVADSINKITHQFVRRLGLKLKVAKLLKKHLDQTLGYDSEVLSASVAAKKVKIPSLVIHDENDEDVPLNWAKNVSDNLEKGEWLLTKNLGHRRILYDANVINHILEFMNRQV